MSLLLTLLLQATNAPPTIPAWEATMLRWLPVVISLASVIIMPLLLMRVKRSNDKQDKEELDQKVQEEAERKTRIERLEKVEAKIVQLEAGHLTNEQQVYRLGEQQKKNTDLVQQHGENLIRLGANVESIRDKVNDAEANVRNVMQMLLNKR